MMRSCSAFLLCFCTIGQGGAEEGNPGQSGIAAACSPLE